MDSLILGQFFVLFALVLTGYLLRRLNIITQGMQEGLNLFITDFAFPSLLIYKIGLFEMTADLAEQILAGIMVSCFLFLLGTLFSYICIKVMKYPVRISLASELSMTAPNNGFMGLPVALLFYGNNGLLYMMCHNIALTLYLFIYGDIRLRFREERKDGSTAGIVLHSLGRIVRTPSIIAIVLGFALAFARVPLHNPFGTYLEYSASLCTPLAMMYIGAMLTGSNIKDLYSDSRILSASIIKTIVLPALTLAAMYSLPLPEVFKSTMVLAMALPTAAIVPVVISTDEKSSVLSSKIVFVTTVLSMITIPVWVKILSNIF